MDLKDFQKTKIFNFVLFFTNFEIQKYYQNDRFYYRYNLPDIINDGTHVKNLHEYCDIGTHWIALYAVNNDITYFDSFGVEHIPKEMKHFIGNKKMQTHILTYDSVMCGYFRIRFIDFMLKGKSSTDFTNLFSPDNFKIMMI